MVYITFPPIFVAFFFHYTFRWFSLSSLTLSLLEIDLSLHLVLRFRYGIALRNPFPQSKPNDIIYLLDFMLNVIVMYAT